MVSSTSLNLSRNSLTENVYFTASSSLKIKEVNQKVCKKTYLSWAYGVEKSVTRDHCSESLGKPRDADQ